MYWTFTQDPQVKKRCNHSGSLKLCDWTIQVMWSKYWFLIGWKYILSKVPEKLALYTRAPKVPDIWRRSGAESSPALFTLKWSQILTFCNFTMLLTLISSCFEWKNLKNWWKKMTVGQLLNFGSRSSDPLRIWLHGSDFNTPFLLYY